MTLSQIILRTRCLPANVVAEVIETVATVVKQLGSPGDETTRWVWLGALVAAENAEKEKKTS